jgi:gamma-glutamylcyclotransferase (GGCT)/AIG2-like uncharacterized protein YtfP
MPISVNEGKRGHDLMPSPKHLFVYGTLRRHRRPPEISGLMDGLEFVAEGSAPGRVLELGSYPGAIFDQEARTTVRGEVYKLPAGQKVLRKLDGYEEFRPTRPWDSLFIRESIAVKISSGEQITCWAYRFNTDRSKKRVPQKQSVKTLRAASTRISR